MARNRRPHQQLARSGRLSRPQHCSPYAIQATHVYVDHIRDATLRRVRFFEGVGHGCRATASDGLSQVLVLERDPMSEFMSHYLVPAAIIAVAAVLVLGLINMMRGGSPNRSQKLMRLRVLFQFIAIIVIMATIWAMGR